MYLSKICLPFIFMLLCMACFTAGAQPDYWQKENQKYLENYRQKIADNIARGNDKSGGYTIDKNAIEELVKSWKKTFGPVQLTPEEKKAQETEQAKRDAKYEEAEARERMLEQRYAKSSAPYLAMFSTAGFSTNPIERKLIVEHLVFGCRGITPNPFDAFAAGLLVAKKTFEADKEKSSFGNLLPLVINYAPTWETALTDLDFLEKRFPQSRQRIDTARLLCLAYFFGAEYPTGLPRATWHGESDNCFENKDSYKQDEMLYKFEQLTEKYEGMAMKVAATATFNAKSCQRNPLYQLITTYKNEPAKAAKFARLTLYTLPPITDEKECTDWSGLFAFNDAMEYYGSLSVDEWNNIAAAHGGSAMGVVKMLFFHKYELDVRPSKYRTQLYSSYKTELAFWEAVGKQGVAFNVLEKLAAGGDAEALNCLAVATGLGLTKGNKAACLWMLQEAAKAGSVWAPLNLLWAAGWGLKGYSDEEKQQAEEGFNQFVQAADKETVLTVFRAVHKYQYIYKDSPKTYPWIQAMPLTLKRNVLKRAAELGNTYAKDDLTSAIFN